MTIRVGGHHCECFGLNNALLIKKVHYLKAKFLQYKCYFRRIFAQNLRPKNMCNYFSDKIDSELDKQKKLVFLFIESKEEIHSEYIIVVKTRVLETKEIIPAQVINKQFVLRPQVMACLEHRF